jgi:peptide-methionine (S)-S-oxide reductase
MIENWSMAETNRELATFGGGCFWAVEEAFRPLKGVIKTSVGYMGGHFDHPCHWDVVARITGHAEVAQVEFEPTIVSYDDLLEVFWRIHDPTSLNRQGADRGEQYRSVIFCHTAAQLCMAETAKRKLDRADVYDQPIVTAIQLASDYWPAKEEHQQYLAKKRQTSTRSG